MRTLTCFALILLFAGTSNLEAQIYQNAEACMAATEDAYYVPSILTDRKLASNEEVIGFPADACVEMTVPEDAGGRAWVKVEAGRRFIRDKNTRNILRLAECNNQVFDLKMFPRNLFQPTSADTVVYMHEGTVYHEHTGELAAQLQEKDEGPGFCGGGWKYVCGAAVVVGGWAVHECFTDWCREKLHIDIDNGNTNRNGFAALRVPIYIRH